MIIDVDSKHKIRKPDEVAASDYLEAARGLKVVEEQALSDASQSSARIENALGAYKKDAHGLFGDRNYTHYREELRNRLAKYWSAADGLPRDEKGLEQMRANRKQMQAEISQLQEKFDIDKEKLAYLQQSRDQELTKLSPIGDAIGGVPSHLVPTSQIPNDIRIKRTNPWISISPPYPGWAWAYSWSRRGGMDPWLSRTLSSTTGEVGSFERVWDSDASDDSYMHIDCRNRIGVFYEMPVTGLVESYIELQNIRSYHQVVHDDEFGWSSGTARVGSRITLQVVSPVASGESSAIAFEVWRSGTDFIDWGNSYALGGTYWAHLFSDRVYTAGQMLYILAGSYEYLNESVNDVSYNDQITYDWFIRRVWLRSSGE